MKILLSAFEPFGGEMINPTQKILACLPDELEGVQLIKVSVPVEFDRCCAAVTDAIHKEEPDAVIMFGQAGGRDAITPERVAINLDDARMADNAGNTTQEKPIDKEGPAAYFSTLPVKAIMEAIQAKGIPARISNTAGTYVCNHLMYAVLHELRKENRSIPAGFVHVPYLKEQVEEKPGVFGMELSDMVEAAEQIIKTVQKYL